ncbi:hypothetical protein GQ44DRAFT_769846 [Phaeosphaeriaceae sp. PMI808]|nr:hypothetical protein GQ44DRAFT_769846 [Phaeosphaeriaceae sp. PMI808]
MSSYNQACHLLGKKSWNVYNSANIARVKADEEAAAAREAADEQRMQELDAARRAAILRGQTPPPLSEESDKKDSGRKRERDDRGHDRKKRKLVGEDDTDMDIRLASTITAPKDGKDKDAKILKLRNTKIDAPLTDHAGNIDLFPVDIKEALEREKNTELEKEKRKKERSFEDQYTMRFSNAAGKVGLEKPWYAAHQKPSKESGVGTTVPDLFGFEDKNVWGDEDPRRKERARARITSNDPFAFMQQAQTQLKKSKDDKKKWAAERDRELRELRATQERDDKRSRHRKRKKEEEHGVEDFSRAEVRRSTAKTMKHGDSHNHDDRSRSRDRSTHHSSRRYKQRHGRSRSRTHERVGKDEQPPGARVRDDRSKDRDSGSLTKTHRRS